MSGRVGRGAAADARAPARTVSRPWLLSMLRDAVAKKSPLAFFSQQLLPLAKQMQAARQRAGAVESKQLHTLVLQLWALLPGFAHSPPDLAQAFPPLAKEIGAALTSEPDARPALCSALQTLIETGARAPSPDPR